jgi:serine/threonine-protein kinase
MSLEQLLVTYRAAGRRMPLDLALFVGAEIAEGLAGARAAKSPEGRLLELSHLDLSPRSALLSYNGEVKVEGFGLAMPLTGGSGVRSVRGLGQRIAAMAPEVVRGKGGDARSDVFSLGIILHEMLVGPRFPEGTTDTEACTLARDGEVYSDLLAPALQDDLTAILLRCLSLEPKERQAHAGVVAYDLRHVALKMGVGDARVFLRSALFEMSEGKGVSKTERD